MVGRSKSKSRKGKSQDTPPTLAAALKMPRIPVYKNQDLELKKNDV
jgi:hypothetical protein